MAKAKKRKAEKIFNKKSSNTKTIVNPFEVHINKQKYQVLGQKLKNDQGLPGVSRAKALRKRKHTLLPEYNIKHKSNKFIDRRIGEKNFSMSNEDRTMARFTAERMKHHNKKSIYNLADNEVLTHRGQTLNEIEKFDDPRSDVDDDEEDEFRTKSSGKLDENFVSDAHFGGGILTKTGKEGAKSHKDLIDQLIAESKKRKAEKQKTKEETVELTEKLDSEWKDLLPLVSKSKKTEDAKPEVHQKSDDYDKVMRELKFEARGHPSDRLKSEDEIAKEEKERLEKLEENRLNRMMGITEKTVETRKHKSADDLDDDFVFDCSPEDTLAYDEEGALINGYNEPENQEKTAEESEQEDDKEEENKDEESSEEGSDNDLSDLKESESESSDDELDSRSETIKDITINNETQKNTKDNNTAKKISKNDNKTHENLKNKNESSKNTNEKKRKLLEPLEEASNKVCKIEEMEIKEENDLDIQNEIIEKAKKELPYTYSIPESYEALQELFSNKGPEYQNVIIERMLKCNHPSLAEENKENLGRLFIYLLQYLNDVASESCENIDNIKKCFSILNSLIPHLYTLTQLNPKHSLESVIEVIKEKQNDYKRKQKKYPGIDVLVFLKLISFLFPTSDFRHQVVTPVFVFISQMLTNCRVKTPYDITYGLFLVTLFLEYTSFSKRYLPAAINFLIGIIHMAVPKIGVRVLKIFPPFKSNSAALVLPNKSEDCFELKMFLSDFIDNKFTNEFKIRTLNITLKLCQEFQDNWAQFPSEIDIFKPFFELLQKLPAENYPDKIKHEIEIMSKNFEERQKNKKLNYLMIEKKKPKALRLYEPNIQQVFEYRRSRPMMSREKAERDKLLYKYKKEMKGAMREIRKDKSYLGRVKIKRQIQSDYERNQKVKQIFAEASIQQSELNAFDRKKKTK